MSLSQNIHLEMFNFVAKIPTVNRSYQSKLIIKIMSSKIEQQIYNLLADNSWLIPIINVTTTGTSYEQMDLARKAIVVIAEITKQDRTLQRLVSNRTSHYENKQSPAIIRNLAFILIKNARWLGPMIKHELHKHRRRRLKNNSKKSKKSGIVRFNERSVFHSTGI